MLSLLYTYQKVNITCARIQLYISNMTDINSQFIGKLTSQQNFIRKQHINILGYSDVGIQEEYCHLSDYADSTFHVQHNDLLTDTYQTTLTAVYETAGIITTGFPTYKKKLTSATGCRYKSLKSFASTSISMLSAGDSYSLFSNSSILSIDLPNCMYVGIAACYYLGAIRHVNMPKLSAILHYNFDLYGTPLNGRKWAFPELQEVYTWCFEKPISCSFFLPKLKKAQSGVFGIGSRRSSCVSNKFFLGPEPPELDDYSNEFSGVNCSVIVPTGAAAAYQADD